MMRFVLFNVAVIAALFFLFQPGKVDLSALADKAYAAFNAKRPAEKPVQEETVKKVETVKPVAAEPAVQKPVAAKPTTIAEVAPKPVVAEAAKKQIAKTETVAPVEIRPEALDPAVAKRRAEVLGIAPIPAEKKVFKEEDKLMTADQRRRELFSLAEEMELFYVKRLSR